MSTESARAPAVQSVLRDIRLNQNKMPRSRRGGTGGLSPSTVGLSLAEGRAPKITLARSRAVMPSMLWETGQKENGEESVFTRSSESDSFGSGNKKARRRGRAFWNLWCPKSDSNRRPIAYKAIALPTELLGRERAILPKVQSLVKVGMSSVSSLRNLPALKSLRLSTGK